MVDIDFEIIESVLIENHSVPDTRMLRYTFVIKRLGLTITSGMSTVRKNRNGVFLDLEDLHQQVLDASLLKYLIVQIKRFFSDSFND